MKIPDERLVLAPAGGGREHPSAVSAAIGETGMSDIADQLNRFGKPGLYRELMHPVSGDQVKLAINDFNKK